MSLKEQNRMLHILHRNDVSRKNITYVMKDLNDSGIFDDFISDVNNDDWEFMELMEAEADWLFSDISVEERLEALENIQKRKEELDNSRTPQYISDQEVRIQKRCRELIEKGIVEPDKSTIKNILKITTRYGRTPLHEAIFMRDIRLVRKYLRKEKYLEEVDNNGHTAMEMAFYEDYKEALVLFKKHKKKKKSRQ